jgi:hypothetical protein
MNNNNKFQDVGVVVCESLEIEIVNAVSVAIWINKTIKQYQSENN